MSTALRHVMVVACGLAAIAGCGDDAEPEGEPLPADAAVVLAASSDADGRVTSVRFELERSGAPCSSTSSSRSRSTKLERSLLGARLCRRRADRHGRRLADDRSSARSPSTGRCGCRTRSPGKFEALPPDTTSTPPRSSIPRTGGGPLLAELQRRRAGRRGGPRRQALPRPRCRAGRADGDHHGRSRRRSGRDDRLLAAPRHRPRHRRRVLDDVRRSRPPTGCSS